MDLQQRKLTKSEWDSIEKPIADAEIEVLRLITDGYNNVNIRYNKNNTANTTAKKIPTMVYCLFM